MAARRNSLVAESRRMPSKSWCRHRANAKLASAIGPRVVKAPWITCPNISLRTGSIFEMPARFGVRLFDVPIKG